LVATMSLKSHIDIDPHIKNLLCGIKLQSEYTRTWQAICIGVSLLSHLCRISICGPWNGLSMFTAQSRITSEWPPCPWSHLLTQTHTSKICFTVTNWGHLIILNN